MIHEVTTKIAALPFVEKATAWTKAPGKERIYIDLKRYDAHGRVFGGVGGACYIDMSTGKLMHRTDGYAGSPFCNSYTLHFHRDNDSFTKIKDTAGL